MFKLCCSALICVDFDFVCLCFCIDLKFLLWGLFVICLGV